MAANQCEPGRNLAYIFQPYRGYDLVIILAPSLFFSHY